MTIEKCYYTDHKITSTMYSDLHSFTDEYQYLQSVIDDIVIICDTHGYDEPSIEVFTIGQKRAGKLFGVSGVAINGNFYYEDSDNHIRLYKRGRSDVQIMDTVYHELGHYLHKQLTTSNYTENAIETREMIADGLRDLLLDCHAQNNTLHHADIVSTITHNSITNESEMSAKQTTTPAQKIDNRLLEIENAIAVLNADDCTLDDEQIKAHIQVLAIERADINRQLNSTSVGYENRHNAILPIRTRNYAIVGYEDTPTTAYNSERAFLHANQAPTIDRKPCKRHTRRYTDYMRVARITKRIAAYNRFSMFLELVDRAMTLTVPGNKQDTMLAIQHVFGRHYDRLQEGYNGVLSLLDHYASERVKYTHEKREKLAVTIAGITKTFALNTSGEYSKPMLRFVAQQLGTTLRQHEIESDNRVTIVKSKSYIKPVKVKTPRKAKVTKTQIATIADRVKTAKESRVTKTKVSQGFAARVQPLIKTW